MLAEDRHFYTLSQEELWQRYCGFTDLSIDKFIDIQNYLLMQQIELVSESTLGKKIIGNGKPKTVEEFRKVVPLTKYDDYEPYLSQKREDALAVKPLFWCHSAGRGGDYKWIPYTSEAFNAFTILYGAFLIMAAASNKGEVKIYPGERLLFNAAPRPYASGTFFYHLSQVFSMHCMPPFEVAETISFADRLSMGFNLALRHGLDDVWSIASVLVKVGEMFAGEAQGIKLSFSMLHPQALFNIIRGLLRAKLARRPMLPRDIWDAKSIMTSGTDTSIYKDAIAYYWGKEPYEIYASTEFPCLGANLWNKRWLTLIPHACFYEFIPEKESIKSREDSSYHPSTVLASELEAGKVYEVVATEFYGMPLLRYKLGDAIKVIALSDEEAGVNLPQFSFHNRVGETIDLAGLARLTERVIWQAIANSDIKYNEWSVCKEYDSGITYIRFYIELKESREVDEIERIIDEQLRIVDHDYRDINDYLNINPVKVTLLSPGTFDRYYQERVKEGADLAHLKPPHMTPPKKIIEDLIRLSG
ncbi:GH3 auxin-responsive promoter family protein [Chloroflexota bacterium]